LQKIVPLSIIKVANAESLSDPSIIPVDSIAQATDMLDKLEVTVMVCRRILEKSDQYGEPETLRALSQTLRAAVALFM
jgi:hypothetical protein